MDCIFCKIASKSIPTQPIYEDELCMAFYDMAPQAPVHFLVIPKQHYANMSELSKTEDDTLLAHILRKIPEIATQLGISDYRVVNNNGEQAGQTVGHVHFHVLSGRDMTWPPG